MRREDALWIASGVLIVFVGSILITMGPDRLFSILAPQVNADMEPEQAPTFAPPDVELGMTCAEAFIAENQHIPVDIDMDTNVVFITDDGTRYSDGLFLSGSSAIVNVPSICSQGVFFDYSGMSSVIAYTEDGTYNGVLVDTISNDEYREGMFDIPENTAIFEVETDALFGVILR